MPSRRSILAGLASLAACRIPSPPVVLASEAAASIEAHRARLRRFAYRGGSLAYVDEGQGDPVVLVHGVPTSSWMYRYVIDELVARGYRAIAPDLMGWGSSLEGFEPRHTGPAAQAQALLDLARSLGLRSWTQVCHDIGGPVTFELLGVAPRAVRALVILDTFAFEKGFDPPLELRGPDSMAARLLRRGFADRERARRWTALLLRRGLADGRRVRDDALVEGYARPLYEGARQTLVHFVTSLDDYRAQLPRYQRILAGYDGRAKTAWGRHDRILDPSGQVARLTSVLGLSSDDVAVLEDAGHFLTEERPDAVVAAVDV